MNRTLNRATRRRLKQETLRKLPKIEDECTRREIIRLHADACSDVCYLGNDFSLRVSPEGLTWGEREEGGFCSFEVYGPDGGHLFGYSGDGYDLETEVFQ